MVSIVVWWSLSDNLMAPVEESIFHLLICDISGGIGNNNCHLGVLMKKGGRQ